MNNPDPVSRQPIHRCRPGILLLAAFILALSPTALVADQEGDFGYSAVSGTVTITNYTGPGGAVSVPGLINGMPVTGIGAYSFSYATNLTGISLPNGVTNVGGGAFYFCGNLATVTLPASLKRIEYLAFYNCSSLTGLDLPEGIVALGNYAFSGCSALPFVTIPNSLTTIGESAFYSCTSLSAFSAGAPNAVYSSLDGVLFNKLQTTLVAYPGGKTGAYTVPATVTNIGDYSFAGCTNLAAVTTGGSVTAIGNTAFSSCTSLTNVTFGSGVTTLGDWAFERCTSLATVGFGMSLTRIGNYVFSSCTSLTGLSLPNSVATIGTEAFRSCSGLAVVRFGGGIANVGDRAFYTCTNLAGLYFRGNAPIAGASLFENAGPAFVYYLPGTTGWGSTFSGRPAIMWNPRIETADGNFGIRTNRFGFTITGNTNLVVVIEGSANLSNPVWSRLATNILFTPSSYFSDSQPPNASARFYRLSWP